MKNLIIFLIVSILLTVVSQVKEDQVQEVLEEPV